VWAMLREKLGEGEGRGEGREERKRPVKIEIQDKLRKTSVREKKAPERWVPGQRTSERAWMHVAALNLRSTLRIIKPK